MESATKRSCSISRDRRCSEPIVAVAWVALVFAAAVPGYAQNAAKAPVAQKQLVGQILGTVRSGNMAVPGATISAVDSDSGKRVLTSSNVDGSYVLHLPPGDYNVQVQMTAFAAANREAVINSSVLQVQLDFDLILQSRINQKRTLGRLAGQGGVASPGMGGMQAMLAANGDEGGNGPGDQVVPQGMPVPGLAPNGATESVAVSGNTVNNQFSGLSTADMEQRVREWREQRANSNGLNPNAVGPGGQEGPGGGARPGAAAAAGPRGNGVGPMMVFGGRGRFNINRPHGTLFYDLGDAALDAAPYSLTGAPVSKLGYVQHKFGGGLGGPLNIPKIYNGGDKTFFFVSYTGLRSTDPFDAFSTVPTLD